MDTQTAPSPISQLISNARKAKYDSAKEYWTKYKTKLKVCYAHYAAVESGKKFPQIELALAIAKTLEMNTRVVCFTWTKEQMPTKETKDYFDSIFEKGNKSSPIPTRIPFDESYVFTEHQVSQLKDHPETWRLIVFLSMFQTPLPPTISEAANALELSYEVVSIASRWLQSQGLIKIDSEVLTTHIRYCHIPNTETFKTIRDNNFNTLCNQIVKKVTAKQIGQKVAYRTTYMRRMTEEQAASICIKIDSLIATLGNMEYKGSDFYGFSIGFAPIASFEAKGEN